MCRAKDPKLNVLYSPASPHTEPGHSFEVRGEHGT